MATSFSQIAAIALIFLLCIGGGSTRPDVVQLLPLRLFAIVLIAALILDRRTALRPIGVPLLFLGIVVASYLAYLVPLPPEVWQILPGRGFYAAAAEISGDPQPWRPLSLAPDMTIEALLSLLPVVAIVLLLDKGDPRLHGFLPIGIVVLASGSVFLALLQFAAGEAANIGFYASGTDMAGGLLANRNHQALLLAMGMTSASWLAARDGFLIRNDALRLLLAGGILIMFVVTIVLTGSRAGLVLIVLAMSAAFLFNRRGMARLPIIARIVGLLGVLAALAMAAFVKLPSHRIATLQLADTRREAFWSTSFDAIRSFFPFGAGPGSFSETYKRFERLADLRPQYVNHAHNDFIEIAYELGALGWMIAAVFSAFLVVANVRLWRLRQERMPGIELGRLASMLIVLALVASVTDYPIRTPLIGVLFAAAATILFNIAFRKALSPSTEAMPTGVANAARRWFTGGNDVAKD